MCCKLPHSNIWLDTRLVALALKLFQLRKLELVEEIKADRLKAAGYKKPWYNALMPKPEAKIFVNSYVNNCEMGLPDKTETYEKVNMKL